LTDMPILHWKTTQKEYTLPFEGAVTVADLLRKQGIPFPAPCGGKGTCGKCAVVLQGAVSTPNEAEKKAGCRLACQALLLGETWGSPLREDAPFAHVEGTDYRPDTPLQGISAAVDIGTTTIAVKVFDADGSPVGDASALNPQGVYAADVIGRIDAALKGHGEALQSAVIGEIQALLQQAGGGKEIASLVVTGNTAMLYLLTGRSPASIATFPFRSETLFGETWELLGKPAYLPPCMNAFVGADITCALLASGMCEKEETALLCDVGTNGEIALWKDGKLYVTSTAAGPAFEGAEVSHGCGYIPGAVDRLWVANGKLHAHTVGEKPAIGICGSGLLDAAACLLELEELDETGAMDGDFLPIAGDVTLTQKDIRALQLAKAAIAAGMEILLARAGVKEQEVVAVYLAGGFGTHLSPESAVKIGLLPRSFLGKIIPLGNAALQGACMLLGDSASEETCRSLAASAIHVELGGSADFNDAFVEHMFF